ncbi:MAG: 3'-5' exonuclease [Gammaproteobacteria bacterium]|nr:3'-5' exonuclease [Gammaproteobacteria bacterium]
MIFNTLVFDIETIPDVDGARRLWHLDGLSDEDVAKVMVAKRQQETDGQSEFIRHHLQKICTIAAVFRFEDRVTVWSLGDEAASEAELLKRFYDGIERYSPTLVSWNGGGFDLPVMHYRALLNGVAAPRYWETGNDDTSFRYNNYLGRYHWRHLDLMDVLSGYQPRATAKLDEMATLMGFPGKLGMTGGDVWKQYLAGGLAEIRAYCETDVLNTYLLFLAFERMRGNLHERQYVDEHDKLRTYLAEQGKTHFGDFLAAWPPPA